MRRKKKLLEMTRIELEALLQIILPGRNVNAMSKEGLQEEIIHW